MPFLNDLKMPDGHENYDTSVSIAENFRRVPIIPTISPHAMWALVGDCCHHHCRFMYEKLLEHLEYRRTFQGRKPRGYHRDPDIFSFESAGTPHFIFDLRNIPKGGERLYTRTVSWAHQFFENLSGDDFTNTKTPFDRYMTELWTLRCLQRHPQRLAAEARLRGIVLPTTHEQQSPDKAMTPCE